MGRTHLIYSNKWGLWHRRSEDGGACGYTSDILEAGVFETAKAWAYDDSDQPLEYQNNTAVSLHDARARLEAAIATREAAVAEAKKRLEAFDAAR
jgi:hypothetical protein